MNVTDPLPSSPSGAASTTIEEPVEDGSPTSAPQCLLMPVGADWYLLDMRWLHEVVAQPRVTVLPTAPRTILGLFNMRGEIIPLFDTGILLGLSPVGSATFALVVQTDVGAAGLAASGVPESVPLSEPIGESDVAGATSVHAFGGRIATLLDVDVLFDPVRIGGRRT